MYSRGVGPLADSSRLFRRGLALVDARAPRDPIDAMARSLDRPTRPLATARAVRIAALKYGACVAFALGVAAPLGALTQSIAIGMFVFAVAFYVVEVQLVFLFPIALDAAAPPTRWWSQARALTSRVGTWRAFWTVVPIAARMVIGVVSTSPLRGWCAGCAAIVVWYEELTTSETRTS